MRRAAPLLVLALLGACDDMGKQPKTPPQGERGQAAAHQPDGMVSSRPDLPPPALTQSLVERGRDEFHAFCTPCHSERGDGNGMIVQRGFPRPPSFLTEQARALTPRDIYTVITEGRGAMYSFAARIDPSDRWAVVAYVRALQASRDARPGDVPPDAKEQLR